MDWALYLQSVRVAQSAGVVVVEVAQGLGVHNKGTQHGRDRRTPQVHSAKFREEKEEERAK